MGPGAILELLAAIFVTFGLTSSVGPSKFEAIITINSDGSYTYKYEGVLVNIAESFNAAVVEKSQRKITADEEARNAELASQFLQNGFQKAEYLGKGEYSVLLERTASKWQPTYFPSTNMRILSIVRQDDGSIAIRTFRPGAALRETMKAAIERDRSARRQEAELKQALDGPLQPFFDAIDKGMDGTLRVTVARGVKVIEHNAASEPSLFGTIGSYQWRMNSSSPAPFMIVRPAS